MLTTIFGVDIVINMIRSEEIGKRCNQLKAEGYRSKQLYDKIREEFGPVSDSSIRVYASEARRSEFDPLCPITELSIRVNTHLLYQVARIAKKKGMSIEQFLISLMNTAAHGPSTGGLRPSRTVIHQKMDLEALIKDAGAFPQQMFDKAEANYNHELRQFAEGLKRRRPRKAKD